MEKPFRHPKITWFLAFLLCWFLFSCAQYDLKQPGGGVILRFMLDREPSQNESLSFQGGNMDIESIVFAGDRDNGEDITFISDFGTIVSADLSTGNTEPVIEFDIPRGTYNEITLFVDPDDAAPDIVVTGRYIPALLGTPIPIQLEIDLPGHLSLIATPSDPNSNVILHDDSRATIEIFLNPSHWFADIPVVALEAAELGEVGGVPSIVISKDLNPEIYSKLSTLVQASAEAIFK